MDPESVVSRINLVMTSASLMVMRSLTPLSGDFLEGGVCAKSTLVVPSEVHIGHPSDVVASYIRIDIPRFTFSAFTPRLRQSLVMFNEEIFRDSELPPCSCAWLE